MPPIAAPITLIPAVFCINAAAAAANPQESLSLAPSPLSRLTDKERRSSRPFPPPLLSALPTTTTTNKPLGGKPPLSRLNPPCAAAAAASKPSARVTNWQQ